MYALRHAAESDDLLTENPVVPQYVADHCPGSGLAPSRGAARYRLQLWLNFITSELHKLVLRPRVARAFAEEMTLYTEEQARRAAAAA